MTASAQSILYPTWQQRFLQMLLQQRVRITSFIFLVLLLEDLIARVDPHSLANFRDYHVPLGLMLVLSGVALRSWAAGTIQKRRRLAMTGPYSLVRHPLYIGSLLLMLGFCALIDDPENIFFVLGPVLMLYVFHAVHEEKHIAAAFPDQWPAYAASVPRFIPRRLPNGWFADWTLVQWLKNREYQAVVAVAIGLAATQAWHALL
jgi:protein-S-isoprenylcysteine O-methyltransferase Ste14